MRRLLAGVAGIAVLLGITAPVANAAEAEAEAAPRSVTRYADPTAAVAADHWSAERIRQAEENIARDEAKTDPRPKTDGRATSPLKVNAQVAQVLAEPAAPVVEGAGDVTANAYITRTVGKVYYDTAAGEPKVCSAAVVNSNGQNMLFTAGHCVHQGDGGQWHNINTWEFHAGRTDGGTPDGHIFRAHSATTWNSWINDGEHDYDDAVVILKRNIYGWPAAAVVGANGLRTGGAKDQYHTIIGYLGGENFQRFLEGLTGASALFPNMISFQGRIGPGASGGPWLLDYTNTPDQYGVGYVHGVTSIGNDLNWSWSPYFVDAVEGQLYRDHKDIHT
jgi:V8-like Glu-specific endopeptidase